MSVSLKDQVRQHWEDEPCGTSTATAAPGTREFFDEVERERYRLEPFIPAFAEFESWHGRRVLEVGIGLGTDFVQFVRAGADATGIDLTDSGVAAVRARLGNEGLEASLVRADAEQLPFADGSFDLVYSWGVIHHTPNPRRALDEVRRVLAPGGEARIMLYSRRSWFAFGAWARYAVLGLRPWRSITDVLAEHIESPGTKAYTSRELEDLFHDYSSVETTRFVTPYDRRVAGVLAAITGPRLGWFVAIRARP